MFQNLVLVLLLLSQCDARASNFEEGDYINDDSSTPSDLSSSLLPFIFPGSSEPEDIYTNEWDNREPVHDIDELEAILGGPLTNRKFVSVITDVGGKTREMTYKFRTNKRKKRDEIKEMKKDAKHRPIVLNETLADELMKNPEGYESNTIYFRYSHKLTLLERIQETNATIGSPCAAKNKLDHDYCERAAYPNKNKLVCNKVVNKPTGKISILPNTCMCQFYRLSDALVWKQMAIGKLKLADGKEVDICHVPAFGACDHRAPVGIKDINGNHIYEVDICKGHFQCDNREFMNSLISKDTVLKAQGHCTEHEFLNMFEEHVRSRVLLCAKPHPRRFSDYDPYRYYCLPEISRDPNQWRFQKPPSDEVEQEADVLFD